MEYLKSKRGIKRLITFPIIGSLIIPLIITDIWIEIYHRICFPLYGIPYIKRSSYIKIDRHKLKYLNLLQKFYCVYCGYANGFANYLTKIGAETERYWCGIQHQQSKGFIPQPHQKDFAKYNDENDFNNKYR